MSPPSGTGHGTSELEGRAHRRRQGKMQFMTLARMADDETIQ